MEVYRICETWLKVLTCKIQDGDVNIPGIKDEALIQVSLHLPSSSKSLPLLSSRAETVIEELTCRLATGGKMGTHTCCPLTPFDTA